MPHFDHPNAEYSISTEHAVCVKIKANALEICSVEAHSDLPINGRLAQMTAEEKGRKP